MVFVSTSNLYLYCFGGAVVTDSAEKYAKILFESNWYEMPNEFQRYFIIMIAETQRPIYLDGYQLIKLSLEGFMKVSVSV